MPPFDTRETEQTFLVGQQWTGLYRDRYSYQRDTLMEEAVKAWRLNPLARQIANLYKVYNIDGIAFKCEHAPTEKFLQDFWNHDLNNMEEQLERISNELFLTGNLFNLYSVDTAGMVYYRAFPSDQIAEIVTARNDLFQETEYTTKPLDLVSEAQTYINPRGRVPRETPHFMTHEAINRLTGTVWGEGEIWSDLPWLGRYAAWLEDRVRLNRYRNAFMYVVQGNYKSEDEKRRRQNELNANPPKPGSILVTDPGEQWGIMSASLDSFDASMDGMAIKKMIAVNNAPLHYLAEPESSTRTTADAAGTPVFKAFENRQKKFKSIILNILKTAVSRRALIDDKVSAEAIIEITAADATERDNAALALAMGQTVAAIGDLYDRKLIDETEYLRLVYRFSGETLPENFKAPKGIRKDISKPATAAPSGLKTDSGTGEVKVPKNA